MRGWIASRYTFFAHCGERAKDGAVGIRHRGKIEHDFGALARRPQDSLELVAAVDVPIAGQRDYQGVLFTHMRPS